LYFYLANPPTGTQTVTVTAAAANNVYCIAGSSIAYQGVDFTAIGFVGGDGTTTLAAPAGSMQVLLATSTSAITASGWTSRYTSGGTIGGTTTFMALGDATGTGSTYSPTPYPSPLYQLYPAELSGNIRTACERATVLTSQQTSATFTHDTTVGNNLAAVLLVYQSNFGETETISELTGATYNGSAMTFLGTSGQYDVTGFLGSVTRARASVYGITNIASGTGTISITGMRSQGTARDNPRRKDIYVVTFRNVGSFGTPVQSSGNSSVSVSGLRSATILHAGVFTSSLAQIIRGGGPSGLYSLYGAGPTGFYETVSNTASLTGAGVGVTLNAAPTGFFL
jgi:hypothetical protein